MKRALRILKDKRGIAIETALLFMLVIFSLCALITSVATIGRRQAKLESDVLVSDVLIDQIGEDFIAYLAGGEESDFDVADEKYASTVVDKGENISALTLTKKGSSSVVLYIEAEKTGAGVKILRWRYSA